MVEEKARFELGMVKPDEILVQISTPALNAARRRRWTRLLQAAQPLFAPAFGLSGRAGHLARDRSPSCWRSRWSSATSASTRSAWPLAIASSLLYFAAVLEQPALRRRRACRSSSRVVALLGLVAVAARHAAPTARRCACARSTPRGRWIAARRARARLAGDRPLPAPLHRHRRALVGRLPDRRQRGRPVAARPQVRRELAGLDRRSTSSASALFAYKGLWLTVLLYALFVAMSLVGWRAWQRLAATARLKRRFVVAIARRRKHRQDARSRAALQQRARRRRPARRAASARCCASSATAQGRTPRARRAGRRSPPSRRGASTPPPQAHDIVVADTTALMIAVYSDIVFGDTQPVRRGRRRRSAAAT